VGTSPGLTQKLVVPVLVAGATAAAVPFVIAGAPVAIAGGVAGLASGLSGAILARRLARRALLVAGVCVIAFGATQVVRALVGGEAEEPPPKECATPAECEEVARSLEGVQPLRAATAFQRACELGAAEDCAIAGEYWNHLGKLDTQDPAKANALFERGCTGGHPLSCVLLGINLLDGRGTPVDAARGDRVLRAACESGNGRGCRALGIAYRDGTPVAANATRAIELFELGCKANDEKACEHAGTEIISAPASSPAEKARALTLLERTCAAATANCYNLGVALNKGAGGPADPVRARAAYARACQADNAMACNNLASMLRDGEGGETDRSRARELWERACRLHLERACYNLRRYGGP
jgi:TPR repeat protein